MQCWYTEWSIFTCSPNNSLLSFRNPDTEFTCQLSHRRWPSNTNYSWQQVVRQLAGIITCLLWQGQCAQRSAKNKVSIAPRRGLSLTEESAPQRSENKLVTQVETEGKKNKWIKAQRFFSASGVQQCLWIKSIKDLCIIGYDHSLLTVRGSKNWIAKLFFSP